MRAVVVYESMYGATHAVAEQIAAGLAPSLKVEVSPVDGADELVRGAGLLVVGGPTHVHGMTSAMSRMSAAEAAEKDDDLELDPALDVDAPGLRDWLGDLPRHDGRRAAAFDTRIDAPAALTGRASKGIARRLRHHAFVLVAEPESFLVDKQGHLLDGELDRARAWGAELASTAVQALAATPTDRAH